MLYYIARRQRRAWTLKAKLAGQRIKFGSDAPETDGKSHFTAEEDAKLREYARKRFKEQRALADAKKKGLKGRG